MPNLPEIFQNLPLVALLVVFVLGLAGLAAGGDWLCRGAVSLAAALRVRPIIIGLTVVSAATSMPEFFTSLFGTLKGSPGLAIGNVVGSNIANIGLILGISALICPLAIRVRLIRIDVPIMIAVSFIFAALCLNSLSRLDGFFLSAILVGYLFFLVRESRREANVARELEEKIGEKTRSVSWRGSFVWVALGTVALVLGADLLVRSSMEMAGRLGVSDALIGLTVVAIGTSLPELGASIMAAVRRHPDLCAGNIVGSNLMNLLLVSGLVSVVTPIRVDPGLFWVDFPFMLFFALVLWPLFFTGKILCRKEGVLLLTLYAIFLGLTAFFKLA